MVRTYENLCSIEINSVEWKSLIGNNRTLSIPELTLAKSTYAMVEKQRLISSTGHLSISSPKRIGDKSFSIYKGTGKLCLDGTLGSYVVVKIVNSYVIVNKKYFAGSVGNVACKKAGVKGQGMIEKSVTKFTNTLLAVNDVTASAIDREFVVASGSGLVLLEVPFSLDLLNKVEQKGASEVSTVSIKNLVYCTPPTNFFMLRAMADTCTIEGPCSFILGLGSTALDQECQMLGGLLNG